MAEQTADVLVQEDALTPREARLIRAGAVLRWGAILNAALALLVIIGGVLSAVTTTDVLDLTADTLLFRYTGAADTALLAVILILLVNVSALLVVMVGMLAQELWALILAIVTAVANGAVFVLLGFSPALLTIIAAGAAGAIVLGDVTAFRLNPVMLKELRERMRGARAFVVITVYLGLMSGFAVLLYLIQRGVVQNNGSAVTGELGRILFQGVVGIELLLIVFIAPAFTAGAVSNERERKTYDLLQITLLPKPSFIVGKLESALSYIFLLLLAAIPLQSIAFLFGGVSETELVLAFVILTVTAIALGTVGLFFSTLVDRTLTASVRAYTVAFVVMIGIPLVFSLVIGVFNRALAGTGTTFTSSPVIEAAVIYLGAFMVSLNPVAAALASQQLLVDRGVLTFWNVTLSSNGETIPLASPWLSFVIIYLVISTVLVVLAVRRMRRVED